MIGPLVPALALPAPSTVCAWWQEANASWPTGARSCCASPARGDVPAITRLYLELSPESLLSPLPRWPARAPALVARFASLGSGTVCLVAVPPAGSGRLAAEARYVPIGDGTAELALTIRDGYQGARLGHLLLDALVRARSHRRA